MCDFLSRAVRFYRFLKCRRRKGTQCVITAMVCHRGDNSFVGNYNEEDPGSASAVHVIHRLPPTAPPPTGRCNLLGGRCCVPPMLIFNV